MESKSYALKRRLNQKSNLWFDCESIKKTYVVSTKSITIWVQIVLIR